jgi:hypothetical protein
MPSPQQSKRSGRAAEQQVVEWLRGNGYPHAERRILAGAKDRGDVAGVVGLTIEIKAEKRLDLPGYLRELDVERSNTGDEHGLVIVKRRGTLDVGDWFAVQTVRDWFRMWAA